MFRKRVEPGWVTMCAVGLLMATGMAWAQIGGGGLAPAASPKTPEQRLFPNGLPKIEVMLTSALEHHPDVLVARGKVRSAEAEQRQAELKALKDVMDVRDRWEKSNRTVVSLGPANPMAREALSELAAIEWELSFLIGTPNDVRAHEPAGVATPPVIPTAQQPAAAQNAPAETDVALPRGDHAKSMKTKLDETIELNINEVPLKEVVEFLSEKSSLRFVLDLKNLEDAGIPVDSPVTLQLGEVELGAAIQALEDLQSPLSFCVRDYGILVTAQTGPWMNSITVRDFWKLTEDEILAKQRQKRAVLQGLGGMGGMGGGGMGGMGGGGMGGAGFF
ncbi:MAG: hypothetical protein JSS49_03355 [Planctomycetes bacterium]|nr:hypothetical protein [Planctomycetota bacterium]